MGGDHSISSIPDPGMIQRPAIDLNSSRVSFRMGRSVASEDENIRMLSENMVNLMCWSEEMGIPLNFWDCKMYLARGSIEMLNRSGESGHLCLVPLWRVNELDIFIVVLIRAARRWYCTYKEDIMGPWKPILFMTRRSHPRSILSNSFSASSAMIILSWVGFLDCS